MTSALYQETAPRGFPGQKAQANRNDDVVTGVNQSASGVAEGKFVTRDTTQERACKVLATTAEGAPRLMMGLVLRDVSREPGAIEQYDDLSIMREGYAYVAIEDAFVIGDPIFVRCVVAGIEVAGSVRATADSTDCVKIPGVILSAGDAGDLGLIYFNLCLVDVDTDADAVATDLAAHIADTTDAHDASAISNVAAGNIVATTVQAAIDELDTEKIAVSVGTTAGDIMYFNGTAWVRLAIGTAGQTLKVNGGATAPEWVT